MSESAMVRSATPLLKLPEISQGFLAVNPECHIESTISRKSTICRGKWSWSSLYSMVLTPRQAHLAVGFLNKKLLNLVSV